MVSGRLIGHRDGYGFVVPDVPLAGTDLDIFIPPDGMGSALHGDRVEVHVQRSAKGFKGEGRMEGRVIQVTERAQKTVVGQFHCGPHYNYVMPFDQRIPFEIVIPRGQEFPEAEEEQPTQMLIAGRPHPRPLSPKGESGVSPRGRSAATANSAANPRNALPVRRPASGPPDRPRPRRPDCGRRNHHLPSPRRPAARARDRDSGPP